MMIVQMEKLVSTDNVKIHVIVEVELNVLWRITDQSVSVLQDMLEILRYPYFVKVSKCNDFSVWREIPFGFSKYLYIVVDQEWSYVRISDI